MSRRTLALAAAGLLALAACGTDDGAAEEVGRPPATVAAAPGPATTAADGPTADPAAAWVQETVPTTTDSDSETQLAAAGDTVVVVDAALDGTVRSHAATGGGPFVAGPPLATGVEALDLRALAGDGEQWVLLAGGDRSRPRVLTSADGLTWVAAETGGIEPGAVVQELVATDDALVAVGTVTVDVDDGTFRNAAWRSTDGGATWQETALDGAGLARRLVLTDDGLVALGATETDDGVWTSADGGATWTRVEPEGGPAGGRLHDVVALGAELVGSGNVPGEEGSGGTAFVVRSADGGRTWVEAADPPPAANDESNGHQLFGAGGQVVALVDPFDQPFADPERCYADIELCRQSSGTSAHVSLDGDTWAPVDLTALDEVELYEVRATATELVVLTSAGEETLGLARWPLAALLPTAADPPPEPTAEVDLLPEGVAPEPGRRYASPLWLHCGMGWLHLGDQAWQRTDAGPDLTQGDVPPPGWPVARGQLYGFVTLVAPDRVEYSIGDGEVVATYGPPTEEPGVCM